MNTPVVAVDFETPAEKSAARSTLISRNITIGGHRTSVRLEPDMWNGLNEICRRERASIHELCSTVARTKKEDTSLTAAIRVFVMNYYRTAATEEGHIKAGHGYSGSMGSSSANTSQNVTGSPRLVSMPSVTNSGRLNSMSGYPMGNGRNGDAR